MKIKTNNIEFTSFSDGICTIFTEDEEGNKLNKYENLGFSNKVIGIKRYYEAAANQMKIDELISVPMLNNIDTYDLIEINNKVFSIEVIQRKSDTNPPSIDLTLKGR